MISFEPTTDTEIIKRIVTEPRIWADIKDDFDGDPADYEPKVHPQVVYILVKDGEVLLGMLIFSLHSAICWEVTIMMLKAGLGRALEVGKAGIHWIFRRTRCVRIIGRVLKSNRLALKLNKAAGFRVYGVNPSCILREGKLEDFVLFGISKSDLQEYN